MPSQIPPIPNRPKFASLALLASALSTSAATYTVTTTADSGAGSLRQAITNANASPGEDTINFGIGTGARTITPLSPLPAIDDDVIINARTQPGYTTNPIIEIKGSSAGAGASGLTIIDASAEIKGLILNSFDGDGIRVNLATAESVDIKGCWIGTTTTGLAAAPNAGHGLNIVQAHDNSSFYIGGKGATERNIISGNSACGIFVTANTKAFFGIYNNYIGLGVNGNTALGNGSHGLSAAPHHYIFEDDWYRYYVYEGLYLGITGLVGYENVISANGGCGVYIPNDSYEPNRQEIPIPYNLIGTDATGNLDRGNLQDGIRIGSVNLVIIGEVDRPIIIAGNGMSGIAATASDLTILDSYIGTNSASADLGNDANGIQLTDMRGYVSKATIGFNNQQGVSLLGTVGSFGIFDCNIGVDASGTNIGNGGAGVRANYSTADNFTVLGVFSLGTGIPNRIAFNAAAGVAVLGSSIVQASQNAFWSNGGLAIDLGTPSGVTLNDRNDVDSGPNDLQNFPVLSIATPTRVVGTLNSTPLKSYQIDLYVASADPTGYGEGQTWLASQIVPASETASVSFGFQGLSLTPGAKVTAVATPYYNYTVNASTGEFVYAGESDHTTSEFSQNLTVVSTDTGDFSFTASSINVNEDVPQASLTIQRTGGSYGAATVSYSTAPGTAAAPGDYAAVSGTVNFADGQTSSTITVPILNDSTDEANETFTVTLSSPTGGPTLLTPSTATVLIIDNDIPPFLNITDSSLTEGDAGSTNMIFTVSLSAASEIQLSVSWATTDGTALSGFDYTASSGLLIFAPGVTSQQISVPITGDNLPESNETFTVTLLNPLQALLGDASGTGTILDDDPAGTLQFASATYTASELLESRTIVVQRTGGSEGTVTVNYNVTGGTATADQDFTSFSQSGTLSFAPSQTSRSFQLFLLDDLLVEGNETVTLTLSSPTGGATLGTQSTTTLTIEDDDLTPVLMGRVTNLDTGTGIAGATVTLNGSASQTVTTDATGYYTLTSVAIGGNYSVSVSAPGMLFTPVERTYYPLDNSRVEEDFAGSTTLLPEMRIEPAGPGQVLITWPAAATDWALQSSPELLSPNWTPVSATPTVAGVWQWVRVPYGSPRTFFRLHKP